MRSRIVGSLVVLVWLAVLNAQAVSVAPEELAQRRDWVRGRFEGRPPPPRTDPALVVLANHGPILKHARAGKPLRIAGQQFTQGLLCHAPSRILIRMDRRQPVTLFEPRSSGLLIYRRLVSAFACGLGCSCIPHRWVRRWTSPTPIVISRDNKLFCGRASFR